MRKIVSFLAALCLLAIFAPCAEAVDILDIVSQVSISSYRNYLDNMLFTNAGSDRGWGKQHDMARTNIYNQFTSFGLDTALDTFVVYNGVTPVTSYNVIGIKEGSTRPEDIYIIGAHYDSANNPGADDNASGVAGVMEAARVLSQYTFDATLVFIAFDREEMGLIGSYHYVNEHQNDNILGMLSLDMIAYNPRNAAYNNVLIHGRDSSNPWKQTVSNAVRLYGGGIKTQVAGPLDASDHAPFEAAGFEACLMIEASVWSNPNYHQSTDNIGMPGYIDYTYATNLTKSAVGCFAASAGISVVPEPAGFITAGGGLIYLLVFFRRRRYFR